MSWITVIWSATSGACLMLALMHLVVWSRDRRSWENLCFSVVVFSVLWLAIAEIVTMHTESPEVFGGAIRWSHLAYGFGVAGSLGFVHFHFGTGRRWLVALALGSRLVAVVANFTTGESLHVRASYSLQKITFFGEQVSILREWTPNPWVWLGLLASLAQLAYVADASFRLWRSRDSESRRRALLIGGTLSFFILFTPTQAGLVAAGVLRMPFMVSFPFLGMLLAMGYELSRDVLRAARLARQLRESEERMNLAAGAASLGMWTWDIPRDEIWVTEEGRALFGWTQSEPVNFERFIGTLHPDDREPTRRAVRQVLEGGGVYEAEYRAMLAGGGWRWMAARGQVERNGTGQPLVMRGVSIDITARRQAEEKFRLAVEASPSAIVMTDQRGRILLINALTEKLFGYTRAELVGHSVELLVPERYRGAHPGHRAGFMAAPQARAMGAGRELFARRKDGSEVPVEIGLNPIHTDDEVLVLCAIADITERLRTSMELHRHRQELAHVSRVSVMGELSASMAHELNQPLTAILSNAQAAQRFMAADQPDEAEFREILKDIVRDTTRARDVIQHLRALVKRSEREFVRVDVNEITGQVISILDGDIVGRNVMVTRELAPELPLVLGDRVQLQQVLLNLLLNAFDAVSGNRQPNRRVTVLTAMTAEGMVRVSVRDTGAGIPPDKLHQIFDAFFTTKSEGMGMGLSVSRSIIESHGGRLWAENHSGPSAMFSFTLPVAEEEGKRQSVNGDQ